MEDKFASDTVSQVPVLPLIERPLFPETLTTLMIARPYDLRCVNWAIEHEGYFLAVLQEKEDDEKALRPVGTLVKITKYIKLPNNCIHLFTTTMKRISVTRYQFGSTPVFADGVTLEDKKTPFKVLQPYTRVLKDLVSSLGKTQVFNFATDVNITNFDSPEAVCWYAAAALVSAPRDFLEELLEETDAKKRIQALTSYIAGEKEVLEKEERVKQELITKMKNRNREAILREQIKALNGELNEVLGNSVADGTKREKKGDVFERAREKKLPEEYREALDKELEKLAGLETMNPEYMLTKLYIETILDLPFDFEEKVPAYSITAVKEQLEKDHYGMKEVKERIVEFLASRLKAQTGKGAVICLAGPPGVGKTSVGSSIAKALGKKFYRFSVGGMRDEAEIKGHRRTYIGAMPGKILAGLKITKTKSPVFMIDEIDKMGSSAQGDPASALLEVLDPEQNITFRDSYLDLPFDVSNVFFILTANTLDSIPGPLLDRAEIIQLAGYIDQEKLEIARKYLIPKNLEKNGLAKGQVKYTKAALSRIAEEYAREAGVRNYEKCIDRIHRKIITEQLSGIPADIKKLSDVEKIENNAPESLSEKVYTIDAKDLDRYLGKPVFDESEIKKAEVPGTCIGLAWTSMGGDTLLIEAISFPDNKGGLVLTGQMGDVMKESSQIAFNFVKQYAIEHKIKPQSWFEQNVIHLHIPEGATPKDGPSAGITMATTFMSLLTGRIVKPNVAMTGELDLTGCVMPIGGLREKTVAAKRNGIRTIFIPKANERDLEEIPEIVKSGINFVPVSKAMEVFTQVYQPAKKQKEESDYGF